MNPQEIHLLNIEKTMQQSEKLANPAPKYQINSPNVTNLTETLSKNQKMPSFIKDGLIYSGFLLLGVCQTLPWNCFINTYSYLILQLSDNKTEFLTEPNIEQNTYQVMWSSFVGLAINGIQVVSTIINLIIVNKIDRNKIVYPALSTSLISFIIIAGMAYMYAGSNTCFFLLTLSLAIAAQFGNGMLLACCFGLAASLPSHFISTMFLGQSVAGTFTAGLAMVTTSMYPEQTVSDYSNAAFLYYAIAAGFCVFAIPVYYFINKFVVAHNSLQKAAEIKKNIYHEQFREGGRFSEKNAPKTSFSSEIVETLKNIKKIGIAIKYQCVSLLMVFSVTLAVFPAITGHVESECKTNNSESFYCEKFGNSHYFVPTVCFLLINLSDFIGRFLANKLPFIKPDQEKLLLAAAASRGILAGMFFMTRREGYQGVGFMGTDAGYIILMVLFGMSNGYIANLCFVYGPERICENYRVLEEKIDVDDKLYKIEEQVEDGKLVEMAGSLLPVYLCSGLLIGSMLSFGLVMFL